MKYNKTPIHNHYIAEVINHCRHNYPDVRVKVRNFLHIAYVYLGDIKEPMVLGQGLVNAGKHCLGGYIFNPVDEVDRIMEENCNAN